MKAILKGITISIAAILMIIGSLFKILHWPYANEMITVAYIFVAIAVVLIIWNIRKSK